MRLLLSSVVQSYTQCLHYRKLLKKLNIFPLQTSRFVSVVQSEFKYWNFNNGKPEDSVSSFMSQHKENFFSHQILESNPNFNVVNLTKAKEKLFNVDQVVDIEKVLRSPNLNNQSCDKVLDAFKSISLNATMVTLKPISDERYDYMCEVLASQVTEFSDDQIATILMYMSLWPMSESSRANNFNKVWKAIDKDCCRRMRGWSFDTILYFVDHWYILKLTRMSDFVFHSIKLMAKKYNQLNAQQLVQVLFYLNTIRTLNKSISMYNLEHKLEGFADQLSLEELGVATLGFFKTHTSVKSEELLKYIINRTIAEIETLPEITLASFLKCLRLSMQIRVWRELPRLLDALTPYLGKYSLQCLTHVALLTAPSQTLHPPSLDLVSQRLIENIKTSRLKDMEKVLFPLSRLNYKPKTEGCVYLTVVNELSLSSRQEEINTFPRSFVALLHCLTVHSIFPHNLIAKVLDMNFIHQAYGHKRYHFGRELAFIDTSVELECKDYRGPRLPKDTRSYLYKRYSHYAPDINYKMSKHAQLANDVLTCAQTLLGKQSAKFVYVVPSHPRPDIVLRDGGLPEDFVSLLDFEGPVQPPESNTTCLVITSKNMVCPYTDFRLNGETVSKLCSIRLLGYTPKMVLFNEWPSNGSPSDKEQFLKKLLSSENV